MTASGLGERWRRLREAFPRVDHVAKAAARYVEDSGDRLAAAVTYYGFLSLFPLLLLAGSVVGFVVRGNPEQQRELLAYLGDFLPGSLADRLVPLMIERAGTTGVLGLAGLVVAGLGWVDTLRESLRAIWHQEQHAGNLVRKKAQDLLILLGLGATVIASIAVSVVATSIVNQGFAVLQVPRFGPLAAGLALVFALASNVVILVYLLLWLPRTSEPLRRIVRGAVVGAVLLEVAKYLAFFYFNILITRGTDLYGASLAAAFGLLLWINLAARLVMFTAAWTVTAPYREDVRPSGTAGEAAGEAPRTATR